MSGHGEFTSLHALPPCVGDAPVAAVLLRDVVASLDARHGGVQAQAVEVDESGRFRLRHVLANGSPVDTEHAPLAAPELFDGASPDDGTDVYAAACLALTFYLGSSPVPATAVASRAPSRVRLGALRQAHRTMPARLGALPDPFRRVFAQAVAKQAHLRPSPAQLIAQLDAALAAAGPGAEAEARTRVHRLVLLARIFEPVETAAVAVVKAPAHAEAGPLAALHLPARTLPVFARPSGAARAALIAAVAIVATGGVAVAAVVATRGGDTGSTPLAVSSRSTGTPSSSPSAEPVAATSSAAPPATSIAPPASAATPPGGASEGSGGSDGSGGSSDGDGSQGSGSGSGDTDGNSSPASRPPVTVPSTRSTPPPSTSTPAPPVTSTPPSTPPNTDPVPPVPPVVTTTPPTGTDTETESVPPASDTDPVPPASETDPVPPASEQVPPASDTGDDVPAGDAAA